MENLRAVPISDAFMLVWQMLSPLRPQRNVSSWPCSWLFSGNENRIDPKGNTMTQAGARRYIALTIALSLLFSLLPVGVMADTNLTGNASGQSLLSAGVSEEASSTKASTQETLAPDSEEDEGNATLDDSAELSGALSPGVLASPFSQPTARGFAPMALPEGLAIGDTFNFELFKYKITSETTVQVGDGKNLGGLADEALTSYPSLTIPSTVEYGGQTFDVTSISNGAFRGLNASIVSVSIPGSVSYIGEHAFRQMANVGQFILHDGLTSIGQSAFQASVFTKITIPKTVTEYGDTVFRDNGTPLTGGLVIFEGAAPPDSITDKDTQNRDFSFTVRFLNEDNSVFSKVVVPKGTALAEPYPAVPPKSGYVAVWAPEGSHTLTEKVTTSFDVKPAYTPIVTIGETFEVAPFKYEILSSITVKVGTGTAVQNGLSAGADLSSYSSLAIPSTVVSPSGFTFDVVGINANAFDGVDAKLTSFEIPGSVKSIGNYAFQNMLKVDKFILNEGLTSIGQAAFQNVVFAELVVPKTVGNSSYAKTAFRDNKTVKTRGRVVFRGPAPINPATDNVTGGRDVSFTVSFFKEDDSLLIALEIPDGDQMVPPDVPVKTGYEGAWLPQDGHTLTGPVRTSFDVMATYSGLQVGDTFEVAPFKYKVTSPTTVEVGASPGVAGNGFAAGVDLSSYTELVIPSVAKYYDSAYEVTSIAPAAFQDTTAVLERFVVPGSVRTIGKDAFKKMGVVTQIVLNDGLQTIGEAAFNNANFRELNIPKTVTSFGNSALQDKNDKISNDMVVFEGAAQADALLAAEGRLVSYTIRFLGDKGVTLFTARAPSGQPVELPLAPSQDGFPGAWLAPTGFSLENVTNSFDAKCIYPLDLSDLATALEKFDVLEGSQYSSGSWALVKTAESRARALYTMFKSRIDAGEPVEIVGLEESGDKTIAYQAIVSDAADYLNGAIADLSLRSIIERQYFVGTPTAKSYDAVTKAPGLALSQGRILSAKVDTFTGALKEVTSTFNYFPSISYTSYSPQLAEWLVLADGNYVKRTDLFDYPVLGFGDPYEVKVVNNKAVNKLLPFKDWAPTGEALPWGTLLIVKTVNSEWVVYTKLIDGKVEYRYASVDILVPTNTNLEFPTTDPNVWDPTNTPKDPGDPTIPGHGEFQLPDSGEGNNPSVLVGAWPANGSTGVGLNDRFYVAFANNVGGATNPFLADNLGLISLHKADGTLVPAKVSASPQDELKRYLFIQPLGQLEYGTNYQIVVKKGIKNKNGNVSDQKYIISFATETNPYAAPGMGVGAAPSGNALVFGSQSEVEGAGTAEGTDPGTAKPGTTKPSKGNDGKPTDKKTDDKSEGAKVEVSSNNTAPVEPTDGADTIIPINAPSPQSESDEPSGNRAPVAPGVVAGIIAALAIVGALGGRQSIIAKRRREEEDSAAL